MRLYRVLPFVAGARSADEPGHPLYLPPTSGRGRVDNPDHYRVLYFGEQAAGAVAEKFGAFGRWGDYLLRGSPSLPGARQTLVAYELADEAAVLDLDDAAVLAARGLRPSQVVTRDRAVTQRWALEAYQEGRWAGLRWWSYYDPRWTSWAVWATERIEVVATEELSAGHPAVVEASEVLVRPWETKAAPA